MSKKKKASIVCTRCDKPAIGEVSCATCYEEMRKALLDEIAKRDLTIIQQNTQTSILQETVTRQAEMIRNQADEKSSKTRKTA